MNITNIKLNFFLIISFFLMVMLPIESVASEEYNLLYIPIFSLNKDVKKLINIKQLPSSSITSLLEGLKVNYEQLNPAEKYLYIVAQANQTYVAKQYLPTINYLLRAKLLETKINQDQLSRLSFLTLYKTLAESYAETGQFKKAYDAKNTFITKYDNYLKNQRDKHIFSLEEKYETQRKKDINRVLHNQTEFKALEIDELLTNEVVQRRNIYIVIFLVIVFLCLLIRLLIMNKRFYKLSQEDMLTGIKNRRTLFSHGKSAINRSVKSNASLCLLAIKIDDFKLLNDMHGDYIGDELLKQVASLGTEAMRTRDVFGRLEDATFISILPEVSQDEAKAIAQHLKEKISAFNFGYVGLTQQLEMSVAIVELSESLNHFELLLDTSMNVLYEIKDEGGNQIRISP